MNMLLYFDFARSSWSASGRAPAHRPLFSPRSL